MPAALPDRLQGAAGTSSSSIRTVPMRKSRPASVRQADISRSVKGVISTGLNVTRIEIEGGKLVIYTGEGEAPVESPLEAWRRKNGQG